MTITLTSGIGIETQPLDDVVHGATPIDADALIVAANGLRSPGAIDRLAQKLKSSRCVIVAILGPGSERVHDELDELLVGDGTDVESLPTTTWHDDDEAEDVLRLVEQLVLTSGAAPRPRSILVATPLATLPNGLPDLLRLLAMGLKGLGPVPS